MSSRQAYLALSIAISNMPVPAIARTFMNELAKSTQANVGLAILDQLSAVSCEANMNRRRNYSCPGAPAPLNECLTS